ncbi:MAG TPA: beta-L-arabinofuranosidase domain-containing protein [Bryobacteraceae bacterium]|nr:beta-L-arabinofuranosidase domain-containing protein [Bryobacteraceae bacterium]
MLKGAWLAVAAGIACALLAWPQSASRRYDYAVAPIPYKDVQITDSFWTPRLEANRTVSIPGQLDRFEKMGRNPDLRLIEAACYELAQHPNEALRARIDGTLDAAIQNIRRQKHVWSTAGDGSGLAAGNFMEAAAAYFEATGSRKLLDVATEIADDLAAVFGPDKRHDISNHEGIKIGLIRLYRATGNEKYLKLAKFFLDARGNPAGRQRLYGPYAQDAEPVKQQNRAIGHAVRATYLYAPLTDIAALTNDSDYAKATERIWDDAVSKRTYLTGGVGSYRHEENYGDDYDLPNLSCWNEICAAYGNTLWNERLFLLTQDSKYIDVLERTLYNGFLAGVSLSGDRYLYQAPLMAYAGFGRQAAFGPNCCPPNVARLLPQLGSLIYAQGEAGLYVNLFVASKARGKVRNAAVEVAQETDYPWDGAVKVTVNPQNPWRFPVYLRIPGWVRTQPMPGLLYRYLTPPQPAFTLTVNGRPANYTADRGYARIDREWVRGDVVQLNLPMPVEQTAARDEVADDRGLAALERGPLVYCVERADNSAGVFNLVVAPGAKFQFAYRKDLLNGIGTITGNATALSRGANGTLSRQDATLVAIPYYAFGNRGALDMSVWLAQDETKARLAPRPTLASTAKASSSVGNGSVAENYPGHKPPTPEQRWYTNSQDGSGDVSAIQDQLEPVNSEDGSQPYLRLHPQTGDSAWVQYDFQKPASISSVEVYWKDDKQYCVLPKAWRLLYKDGNEWKPVHASTSYGVERDKYNRAAFDSVTTAALRIEIQLQGRTYQKGDLGPPDANYLRQDVTWYEGGVIEWRVNP